MALAQQNVKYDTMEVKVIAPDQGTYVLAYLKPGTEEYTMTAEISSGCDASIFRDAIRGFYKNNYGVNPIVTQRFLNETGAEVLADDPSVVQQIYTIETPKPLWGPTIEQIMVIPLTTKSTLEFVYPQDL